jgi:hypothetical protein
MTATKTSKQNKNKVYISANGEVKEEMPLVAWILKLPYRFVAFLYAIILLVYGLFFSFFSGIITPNKDDRVVEPLSKRGKDDDSNDGPDGGGGMRKRIHGITRPETMNNSQCKSCG